MQGVAAPWGSVGYRLIHHRHRCGLTRGELAIRAEPDPALILRIAIRTAPVPFELGPL